MRDEQFSVRLNGQHVAVSQPQVRYAANGRDSRLHSVPFGPYLQFEIAVRPQQMKRGTNQFVVQAKTLVPTLTKRMELREVELSVGY